jgi:hypothetical protein
VVKETARLIEGDNEEHILPLWRRPDDVIDLLEEDFSSETGPDGCIEFVLAPQHDGLMYE